ncbi:Type II secretion system subunit H, I [Elusimicrobium minutum Pei191]|uniref:Type II secretion system subunit H, I n=1 Tax=Elusimicrobium minutum (strain Pei191) TaxID=445932 RepID=B2KD83_ELUMP|nr:prepilin-type N-terminal cleavage/methylation domain-containing protein [Elusimicrobium minutum]ACC98479.1 Type II secretion system subunit H, I [Elusimicrobium minutum Pei191]
MKKGFTLIELLVVVLIIGILAAIALPQYNKAVEKSRAVEMLSNLSSLKKSVDIFFMEGGDIDHLDIESLSIEIPGAKISGSTGLNKIETRNFIYRVGRASDSTGSPIVTATRVRNSNTLYLAMQLTPPTHSCHNTCCWYTAANESLCKAIGFTETAAQSCSITSLGCSKYK